MEYTKMGKRPLLRRQTYEDKKDSREYFLAGSH
jgi:hypothetical protein